MHPEHVDTYRHRVRHVQTLRMLDLPVRVVVHIVHGLPRIPYAIPRHLFRHVHSLPPSGLHHSSDFRMVQDEQ